MTICLRGDRQRQKDTFLVDFKATYTVSYFAFLFGSAFVSSLQLKIHFGLAMKPHVIIIIFITIIYIY